LSRRILRPHDDFLPTIQTPTNTTQSGNIVISPNLRAACYKAHSSHLALE
jgi:hypothetical protein